MRIFASLFSFAIVVAGVGAAETPLLRIPKTTPQKIDFLSKADKFDPAQWAEAATVNDFRGAMSVVPEETTFYLWHDGQRLLVGVNAVESNPSEAKAFPRKPSEDLGRDEAVQVVIGPLGNITAALNVGGYDNAYSVQSPVNDFYGYTCNRVGAISRTYNETPMASAGFIAKAGPTSRGWFAVLVIDFAKIGVEDPENTQVLLNLFRHYRGEVYGWHLPSYGGYSSLPFGNGIMLRDGVDKNLVSKAGAPPKYEKPAPQLVAPVSVITVEYYPAAEKVTAQIPRGEASDVAYLRLGDQVVEKNLSPVEETFLDIPAAELQTGKTYTAVAWVENARKEKQLDAQKAFEAVPPPDWGKTPIAMEYLEDKTPRPWTAPVWEDGKVVLDHAEFSFADAVLPQQITVLGNELLSAPVSVTAKVNGKVLPVNVLDGERAGGTAVMLDSTNTAGVEVRTRVEFDGFTIVRLRLNGVDTRELEELQVSIPLAPKVAQYVIVDNNQFLHATGGHGESGNFTIYSKQFWVGNERLGMEFSFDRDCVFSPFDGKQYQLSPEAAEQGATYTVNMVTAKGQVKRPDQIFQFFIQPTPSRREMPLHCGDQIEMWHENWSDYQAYPDMSKLPAITHRANYAHGLNKRLFIYFGHVMAENSPGFKEYGTDLMRYPDAHNGQYSRMYDPGKGVPCRAVCFRDAGADLLIDRIDKIVTATDMDGIYFDGPTVPFPCETIGHDCSDSRNAEWDGNYHRGRILGQRSFLKRLRGVFEAHGKETPFLTHTGGAFHISSMGLCDYFYDGEHLNRYRYGYLLEPWRFIMGYTGNPFGWRGAFIPGTLVTSTLTLKQALAWSLVHGADTPIGSHPLQTAVFSIFKRDSSSKFYDYWHEQPHIVNPNKELLLSYFLNENEAIVVAGNITYGGVQSATVDISGLFPGKELDVYQINSTEPLLFDDGKLTITLPETEYRLYHIIPAGGDRSAYNLPSPVRKIVENPAPAADIERKAFVPEEWRISHNAATATPKALSFEMPMVLQSVKGDDAEAEAELALALPDEFKLKLKLAHFDKMRFRVDDVMIRYDENDGWVFGWLIEGVSEFDLKDYSQVTLIPQGRNYIKREQAVEVEVMMKDGRLTFLYDGCQILTNALPGTETRNSHTLRISAWGGDWLTFDVLELSGKVDAGDIPVRIHPIY